MPPLARSRFIHSRGLTDAAGRLYLTQPVPFRYRQLADNRFHTALQGDHLHGLAERYFAPTPGAAQLWWVIGHFQPRPIHDPTIELTPGRVIVIPSLRTTVELIFNPTRAAETP